MTPTVEEKNLHLYLLALSRRVEQQQNFQLHFPKPAGFPMVCQPMAMGMSGNRTMHPGMGMGQHQYAAHFPRLAFSNVCWFNARQQLIGLRMHGQIALFVWFVFILDFIFVEAETRNFMCSTGLDF